MMSSNSGIDSTSSAVHLFDILCVFVCFVVYVMSVSDVLF